MKLNTWIVIALLSITTLTHAASRCVNLMDGHVHQNVLDLSDCDLHPNDLGLIEIYLEAHPQITALNISNNLRLFSDDNAQSLSMNTTLKDINANNTMLYANTESVINSIAGLSHLTTLSVENDRITDAGLKLLSTKATHLTDLDIADNNDISEEALFGLLKNNRSIQTINIDDLPLSTRVIFSLAVNPTFVSIEFGNNNTNTIDDGLINMLAYRRNITSLGLQHIKISPANLATLLKNTHITQLSLRDASLPKSACASFSKKSKLTYLDLSGNLSLDDSCLQSIAKIPTLSTLILNDVYIFGTGFDYFVGNTHLNKVIFSSRHNYSAGVMKLVSLKSLTSLSMHGIEVTDAILMQLANNPNLTELTIDSSSAENHPAAGIQALMHDAHLKNLSITSNFNLMTNDEAVALASNKTLNNLDLSNNRLTESLFNTLKDSSLTKLALYSNQFDPNGEAARQFLKTSTIPTVVLMAQNWFSSKK